MLRIRIALNRLFNAEARPFEESPYLACLKEDEIKINLCTEKFIKVARFLPNMKCCQHYPTRLEHAIELTHSCWQLFPREMDERIKCCYSTIRCIGYRCKRHHIIYGKRDRSVARSCMLNHPWREIDAAHLGSLSLQISGDMSWPAAHIANEASACFLVQPIQHFAVKGFMRKLIGNTRRVFSSHTIIAGLGVG